MQIDWLDGSGAKCSPNFCAAKVTCVFTTPASTTAIRPAASIRTIRFSRFNVMTMPSFTGSEPPDKLVPLPRATNGSFSAWQNRTIWITSSCVSGTATASGRAANAVSPSLS